jgi:two-component system chemotaxis response regulator CheY
MEDGAHLHELLEALEAGTLLLERDAGSDPAASIHRLFQSAHNLKSGLAMAGLGRASKLLHDLEDGLDDIRRGRLSWSSAWADALLDAVDRVKSSLEAGNDDDLDLSFDVARAAVTPGPVLSAEESAAAIRARAAGQNLYRIEKLFLPGLTQEDFEGHLIYDDIRDSGTLVSVRPGWADYSRATGETVVRFLFSSAQSAETLGELFFDPLIELPAPAADPPSDLKFRLLVIEDDPLTSEVVRKTLEGAADVVLAADGEQGALAFARAFDRGQSFDVVVCDLEMPVVDGHTALQRIRDEEESRGVWGLDRCLIFMNTGNRDFETVRRSFRLQADAYFIKPLSVAKIQKRLEQSLPWLQNRRRSVP